jgi:cytoskeletal protein RodZ
MLSDEGANSRTSAHRGRRRGRTTVVAGAAVGLLAVVGAGALVLVDRDGSTSTSPADTVEVAESPATTPESTPAETTPSTEAPTPLPEAPTTTTTAPPADIPVTPSAPPAGAAPSRAAGELPGPPSAPPDGAIEHDHSHAAHPAEGAEGEGNEAEVTVGAHGNG